MIPVAPVAPTPAWPFPGHSAPTGKVRVVRKKDGVLFAEVNTIAEANALIAKAKRQKKATLVIA